MMAFHWELPLMSKPSFPSHGPPVRSSRVPRAPTGSVSQAGSVGPAGSAGPPLELPDSGEGPKSPGAAAGQFEKSSRSFEEPLSSVLFLVG
jgi:hypothetical protein